MLTQYLMCFFIVSTNNHRTKGVKPQSSFIHVLQVPFFHFLFTRKEKEKLVYIRQARENRQKHIFGRYFSQQNKCIFSHQESQRRMYCMRFIRERNGRERHVFGKGINPNQWISTFVTDIYITIILGIINIMQNTEKDCNRMQFILFLWPNHINILLLS